MENKKIYVAYGSNLNLRQMAFRCPGARVYKTGMLKGYRLTFNRYLTVEKDDKYATPVALWEIGPQDEKSLDRYEGYPSFYRKETVTVETADGPVEGMVYIMNTPGTAAPTTAYYHVVAQGYHEIGLDSTYLHEALKRVTK